jgi:multidrug efflux system membrane fusion protein
VEASAPSDSKASTGKLTFINNTVDSSTGTVQLMGTFPNPDRRLWPGEFLNVRLVLGVDDRATVVPAAAIQTGPQGQYVYVVERDDTAVVRSVKSSRTYHQLAVIGSGVQPGDRVIVNGQINVIPNRKVQVASITPVESSPAPQVSVATTPGAGK